MLRLTSSELPTIASSVQRTAPALRIYKAEPRPLAPLFRFDRLANIDPPAFQPVESPLTNPDYSGYLFRLDLGFSWQILRQVTTGGEAIGILTDPMDVRPQTAWDDASLGGVNLYINHLPAEIVVDLAIDVAIPQPVGAQYTLNLQNYANFTATQVFASGLPFIPAIDPDNVQSGEFVQTDSSLTLYGSTTMRLVPGSMAIVQGSVTMDTPDPIGIALTFDLSALELTYIDGVDYLGLSYSLANPLRPRLGEMIWNAPLLTLFVPEAIGTRFLRQPRLSSGTTSTGTLTYTSYD